MPDDRREKLREALRLERGGLLDRALRQLEGTTEAEDPQLAAEALRHRADIHRARCEWERALEDARASGRVAKSAGLHELAAEAVNAEAAVHMSRGRWAEAVPLLTRMLEMTRSERIRGIAEQNLGVIAAERARLGEARSWFERSQTSFRAAEYSRGLAMAMVNTARVALLEGDDERAESLCRDAEQEAQRVGDLETAAMAAFNRAESMVRQGRYEEAEAPASVAMGYFTGVGNAWRRVECFRLIGDLHRGAGDRETARQCYARGVALARGTDTPVDASRLERLLAELDAAGGGNGEEGPTGAHPAER